MILAAVVLGAYAYNTSQADAVLGWEKAHHPLPNTWKYALGALGYHPLMDEKGIQGILKSLPTKVSWEEEEGDSAWVSKDLSWLVVLPSSHPNSDEESRSPLVFSDGTEAQIASDSKIDWHPQSGSWTGFQDLLRKLELRPKKVVALTKKLVIFRDPLEIRY